MGSPQLLIPATQLDMTQAVYDVDPQSIGWFQWPGGPVLVTVGGAPEAAECLVLITYGIPTT